MSSSLANAEVGKKCDKSRCLDRLSQTYIIGEKYSGAVVGRGCVGHDHPKHGMKSAVLVPLKTEFLERGILHTLSLAVVNIPRSETPDMARDVEEKRAPLRETQVVRQILGGHRGLHLNSWVCTSLGLREWNPNGFVILEGFI